MDVLLLSHNPAWARKYQAAHNELRRRLPAGSYAAIEHIGSTAVPGLKAEPVIDVLIGIPATSAIDRIEPELVLLEYYPWHSATPGLCYQRRNSLRIPTHRIHVVEHESPQWDDQLAFRDRLVHSPTDRAAYEKAKLALAAQYPESTHYREAKSEIIGQLLKKRPAENMLA